MKSTDNDGPTRVIELSGYSVTEVKGRDAGAFLQAQTMNDVSALAPGRWQWNGLLSPKGRVLFLFQLLAIEPDRYWLLQALPRAAELVDHLQRFRFRSKVELAVVDGLQIHGIDAPDDLGDWQHVVRDDLRIVALAPCRSGALAVGPAVAADTERSPGCWHAADLAAGIPRIGVDVSDAFTPAMLALSRLDAFSVRKGCYPGQEIVARTHYLGRTRRRVQRLRGDVELRPGQVLEDASGTAIGEVVDAARCGDVFDALCVLREPAAPDSRLDVREGPLVVVDAA